MRTYTTNDVAKEQEDLGDILFATKHIGLTYSNVDQQVKNLTPTQHAEYMEWKNDNERPLELMILNKLVAKFMDKGVRLNHGIVAREEHKDGNVHFHAYFSCVEDQLVHVRDFDICGIHPSVENVRNPFAWKSYIKKCGKFVEYEVILDLTDYYD